VLANQQATGDGRELLKLLETSHATVMQGTPATFRMLLGAGWRATSRTNFGPRGPWLSAPASRRV
jgi:hypothetical protein